jgi:outer membrane receptor protein involved in Fe transport
MKPSRSQTFRLTPAALALLSASAVVCAQEEPVKELPTVEIRAPRVITPLPGVVLDEAQQGTNVQSATGEEIAESRAVTLTDFFNSNFQSVNVNDYAGNPFQQDLSFRGFAASPLVGTPQGLSIYIDGVRVNEPFGEVVNWDLIPMFAIRNVNLMPGSNPLFGLNTLGGAVSMAMKDGFNSPGARAQFLGGAWGRRQTQVEGGWHNDTVGFYGGVNVLDEDGWRANSPSQLRQGYARATLRLPKGEIALIGMFGDNRLTGNGVVPVEQYALDQTGVYTSPDETTNQLAQFQLLGRWDVSESSSLSANIYRRKVRQRSVGGDIWDEWPEAAARRVVVCNDNRSIDGATGVDRKGCTQGNQGRFFAGNFIPIPFPNGVFNFGSVDQVSHGISLQLTSISESNQLVVGASFDWNEIDFRQNQRLAYIRDDRTVELDETYANLLRLVPITEQIERNNLTGSSRSWALYSQDVWSPLDNLHLTFGLRYSHTRVKNYLIADRPIALYQYSTTFFNSLLPQCGTVGPLPSGDIARFLCSSGDYTYPSLDPSIGVSWLPMETLNPYMNFSTGTRVPSVIELGCARDRELEEEGAAGGATKLVGCSIPTALSNDPYLPPVRSRNLEAGVRGGSSNNRWNFTVFRTVLNDDLLFVSAGKKNRGVFDTFGETIRQGVEMGLEGYEGKFSWKASYTLLDATFESAATVVNPSNSTAVRQSGQLSEFQISEGDRIPGIPRHSMRVSLNYRWTNRLSTALTMIAHSFSYSRGNENNEHEAGGSDSDGTTATNSSGVVVVKPGRAYVGEGRTSGYAVFNLLATYRMTDAVSIFARVDNLFDREYATASELGLNSFTPSRFGARDAAGFNYNSNDWTHSQFIGPGAPRAVWVGMNLALGG